MSRQLNAPTEQPISFWRFAGPVLAASLAASGARYAAKAILTDAHPDTQKTAAATVGVGTFWLVVGIGWVVANRRSA